MKYSGIEGFQPPTIVLVFKSRPVSLLHWQSSWSDQKLASDEPKLDPRRFRTEAALKNDEVEWWLPTVWHKISSKVVLGHHLYRRSLVLDIQSLFSCQKLLWWIHNSRTTAFKSHTVQHLKGGLSLPVWRLWALRLCRCPPSHQRPPEARVRITEGDPKWSASPWRTFTTSRPTLVRPLI